MLATAAIGVRALLRLAADRTAPTQARLPTGATSPIFQTAARLLMPLLLLFAMFLLWRGHNEPGGGFVGGLVAAAAFSLYSIAYGVDRARRALLVNPMTLLGAGLLVALVSGIPSVIRRQPFLTAQWLAEPIPVGTPVLFDIGVFIVVTGVVSDDDLQPGGGVLAVEMLLAAGVGSALRGRHLSDAATAAGAIDHRPGPAVERHEPPDLHGRRADASAPAVVPEGAEQLVPPYADPVPQALVLTAIVIGFGLLAFSLVLAHRVHATVAGTDDVDDVGRER